MKAVLLPSAPKTLPPALQPVTTLSVTLNTTSLQQAIAQITAAITDDSAVSYIIGSHLTPALYWFAAKHSYPQAQLWCRQETSEWVNLNNGAVITETDNASSERVNSAVPETAVALESEPTSKLITAAAQSEISAPVKSSLPKKLFDEIFLLFVWGKEEAERVLLQAKEQYASQTAELQMLDKVARQGKHAIMLEAGLKNSGKAVLITTKLNFGSVNSNNNLVA